MSALTTKTFWIDAVERSIKTFAQTSVALLTASGVLSLFVVAWSDLFAVAGLAALISILTSIGSASSGNSASLVVDSKLK